MTFPLPQSEIANAFVAACQAELKALKPGNVHVHGSGHGMEVDDFLRAAEAATPHIAQKGLRVGARIRAAVDASFAATGCNTNLGIVLLCAPLAFAAGEVVAGTSLSQRLAGVLRRLDTADAQAAFAAIARAQPGGLGKTESGDVHGPAEISLLHAMQLAAGRDRIALAYTTDYADIFEFALPLYRQALTLAQTQELAVTTLHMSLLAAFPDTHIQRKFGADAAQDVRREAQRLAALFQPAATQMAIPELAAFDEALKRRGLNPGTTADFVVATLFASGMTASSC